MAKLSDISVNSSYKRHGIVGNSGQIKMALFGNEPDDSLFLGNEIGTCTTEFQVVSHPMPMLEDDFIISIYENQILCLRSPTENYECMIFFKKILALWTPLLTLKNPDLPHQQSNRSIFNLFKIS